MVSGEDPENIHRGAGYSNRRKILPTPTIFVLNRRKNLVQLAAITIFAQTFFHRGACLKVIFIIIKTRLT